ncbi:septal ring lytic transglycosylase RlpA family protein [Bacteroidetes/Chlorobi group bacterium ChocPot_Mid]|nr:MAG: septal ring lytic transglycosylase RlpA family protein [Bacteroidetes/Chlorobi group bacterium ChocPot_Mid]
MLLTITSCTSFVRFTSEDKIKIEVQNIKPVASVTEDKELDEEDFTGEIMTGTASYYADKFHGKKTASGEIYDQDDFTAAHRTLPFGTKVLVTNLENNKSVIVRINDRGPYKKSRLIDVSRAAAEELDMIQSGIVEVEVKVLK